MDPDQAPTCQEQGSGDVCSLPGGMPFGFVSAWTSSVTGLVQMRARWYSPRLAQFVSQDPLGYVDSFNQYTYVGMDPVNGWDPWGLENEKARGAAQATLEVFVYFDLPYGVLADALATAEWELNSSVTDSADANGLFSKETWMIGLSEESVVGPISNHSDSLMEYPPRFPGLRPSEQIGLIEALGTVFHEATHARIAQLQSEIPYRHSGDVVRQVFKDGLAHYQEENLTWRGGGSGDVLEFCKSFYVASSCVESESFSLFTEAIGNYAEERIKLYLSFIEQVHRGNGAESVVKYNLAVQKAMGEKPYGYTSSRLNSGNATGPIPYYVRNFADKYILEGKVPEYIDTKGMGAIEDQFNQTRGRRTGVRNGTQK